PPHPKCDPERQDHQPQIHRISREAERTADHQRLVGFRCRIEFGALAPEQRKGPDGDGNDDCDECNAQPNNTEIKQRAPGVGPTHGARGDYIEEGPGRRRELQHRQTPIQSLHEERGGTGTFAPSRANVRAIAAPMPDPAPVTMATFSVSRMTASSLRLESPSARGFLASSMRMARAQTGTPRSSGGPASGCRA